MILSRFIGLSVVSSAVLLFSPVVGLAEEPQASLRDIQVKVAILTLPNDSVPAALTRSLAKHEPNGPGVLPAAEATKLIAEVSRLRGADLVNPPAATVQEGQEGIVEVLRNFMLRGAGDVNGVIELGVRTSFSAMLLPAGKDTPTIDLTFQASLTDLRPNAQPPFTAESIAYLDLKAKPGIVPVGATAVFHLPQPGAPNSVWFLVTPTPKQAPKLAPARR